MSSIDQPLPSSFSLLIFPIFPSTFAFFFFRAIPWLLFVHRSSSSVFRLFAEFLWNAGPFFRRQECLRSIVFHANRELVNRGQDACAPRIFPPAPRPCPLPFAFCLLPFDFFFIPCLPWFVSGRSEKRN
ncbi:MAG: hypothetical protein D6679_01420 [Candidatus Hydrogenedentota bacterium]|nr:MAG: hypothetical protein D6679_01420 [Candidatus Hydrogenedentota bacterium]